MRHHSRRPGADPRGLPAGAERDAPPPHRVPRRRQDRACRAAARRCGYLTISLRNLQSRPIPTSAALAQVRSVAATALGVERGGVGFAFVDDRAMSGYHQRFMDDPATTDVLSFPASSGSAEADEVVPPDVISEADGHWGDIIICTDQAARQARHLGPPVRLRATGARHARHAASSRARSRDRRRRDASPRATVERSVAGTQAPASRCRRCHL